MLEQKEKMDLGRIRPVKRQSKRNGPKRRKRRSSNTIAEQIVTLVEEFPGELTTREIFEKLHAKDEHILLSTVYVRLSNLKKAGRVLVSHEGSRRIYYPAGSDIGGTIASWPTDDESRKRREEIYALRDQGVTIKEIAEKYYIGASRVHQIIREGPEGRSKSKEIDALSDEKYAAILEVLRNGQLVKQGNRVLYDLGKNENGQIAKKEFAFVATREQVPVEIRKLRKEHTLELVYRG